MTLSSRNTAVVGPVGGGRSLEAGTSVDGEGDPGVDTVLDGVTEKSGFHDWGPLGLAELLLENEVLVVGREWLLVGAIGWGRLDLLDEVGLKVDLADV